MFVDSRSVSEHATCRFFVSHGEVVPDSGLFERCPERGRRQAIIKPGTSKGTAMHSHACAYCYLDVGVHTV